MIVIQRHNVKKLAIIVLIAGLVAAFFITGMQKYLTLEFIKSSGARFKDIYADKPLMVITFFVAFYIPVIALNLPGATVLGLAAGALFGTLSGTIIISFASTIGATLACLLSRYLLQDWVQKKFGERLNRVNGGIRSEGAFYLFSMRLIPVIPFFIINMVMGLTSMRLWTFYWVSQLGMLPGTAIYVNAGSQLSKLDSLRGIISPTLILSLALLGIFPLITRKMLNLYSRRFRCNLALTADSDDNTEMQRVCNHGCNLESGTRLEYGIKEPSHNANDLTHHLNHIRSSCTDCEACKTNCAFLQEYGTPGEIVGRYDFSKADHQTLAFECSLCNLCGAVCPEKLEPGKLFAAIRQKAMEAGNIDLSRYRTILSYEKRGSSPLFSYYAFPKGCDTVFFPGCTLPGTRPETTWQLFTHIQRTIPELGIVLDCCTKPSHDLGRRNHFESMFGEMHNYLTANGIRKVLVACPNCYKIFQSYGKGLEIQTVYEILSSGDMPAGATAIGEMTVHDPCPLREDNSVHDAVRNLMTRMGLTVSEMKHRRNRTLCCGEGGSTGFIRPELARKWGDIRRREAEGHKIVTYCAGCAGFLSRVNPAVHITDILFSTDKALNGGLRVAKSPFTYINRLKLKRRFKGALQPAAHRVRKFSPDKVVSN